MKDNVAAREYYTQALRMMRDLGDRGGEARTLAGLSAVDDSRGDYARAIESARQAVDLAREVGDPDTQNTALYAEARAYKGIGNLVEARRAIEESLRLVDTSRAKVLSSDLRASYFATTIQQYEFYIDLLMQLHREHPADGYDRAAFEASERARARTILDTFRLSQADWHPDIDPQLLQREGELRRLVNDKAAEQTKLLSRKHSDAQAEGLAKQLADLLKEYEAIEDRIRESNPRYSALISSTALNWSEIQRSIPDSNSVLLEFCLGDLRSFLFVVSDGRLSTFQLPRREVVENVARAVYQEWQRPNPVTNDTKAITLSRMLLSGAYGLLRGKRILVVADGVLQYLPFAALPIPVGESSELSPLISAHEVVSLPSASSMALLRSETAKRPPAPRAVAVFADPVFSADDPRIRHRAGPKTGSPAPSPLLERSEADIGIAGFERLLSSRSEAKAIRSLVPDRQVFEALDFDANRQKVFDSHLEDYRVIHFATHGLIDSSHPELSGLVLSLVDSAGKSQNGFLRVNEIYSLRLRAQLVVLSACETALGKDVRGEGLIGLTRAFMYAGAPRVISSVWRVPDRATSELMTRFYEGLLRDGLPAPAALRAAQLKIRSTARWASPYYWAGFVLQGEWE